MKHVSGQQFKGALESLGFQVEPVPLDRNYFRPSFEWVKVFGSWCQRNPVDYQPETFDCDNITEQQVTEADKANRIRTDATDVAKAADHTVVMCIVDIPVGKELGGLVIREGAPGGFDFQRHATGLVWCDDGDFHFVERQTGRVTHARNALARGNCRPVYSRM